jgi:cell division inhibitor SepF
MTTMQRFKAYFGMVPPSDYEDDYLDDGTGQVRRVRGRGGYDDYYGQDSYGRDSYGDDGYDDDPYGPESYGGSAPRRERVRASSRYDEDERDYAAVSNGGYVYTGASRSGARGSARLEPLQRSAGSTLRAVGASASSGGHDADTIGDGQRITTLRPSSYSEARTIGERFRDGNPVIMDLVDMSNADAKRLVDFAAGLAFALRGSFDKVATKVFLLAPADIDVSPEDRRRIAETGFYSHS